MWPEGSMRGYGCGVIAAADLLLYLSRCHEGCAREPFPAEVELSFPVYRHLADMMNRRFLPIIPGHGINGLGLALGLNGCFVRYKLPFTASWRVSHGKLWSGIEDMLARDIPVILAVGPNFPLVWQKHMLPLYTKNHLGAYIRVGSVKSHYVTVTGMDERWLRVSSWGQCYYIDRREYMLYVKAHSSTIVSNFLYIKEK